MLAKWVQALIGWMTLAFFGVAIVMEWRQSRRRSPGAPALDPPTVEPALDGVTDERAGDTATDAPALDHPCPESEELRAISARRDAERRALEDDARRVVDWYRGVLAQLPPGGRFVPVDDVIVPQARKLSGLRLRVGVHSYVSDTGDSFTTLELSVAAAGGGSSISQGQGFGSRDQLLAELAQDVTLGRIIELLDRGGEEIWRGGADLGLDERVAAVRAGTHAQAPRGRDCYRLAPGILRFGGEVEHLFDTDDVRISLHRCDECGQRFVQEFIKVWGDRWNFWTRVSDEEADLIRQDFGWAPAILLARRRVTMPPRGDPHYWDDSPDMVLRMGPRA